MDDELIGKGATTLDWLKHKYPWLKTMLDTVSAECKRAVGDRAKLREAVQRALEDLADGDHFVMDRLQKALDDVDRPTPGGEVAEHGDN